MHLTLPQAIEETCCVQIPVSTDHSTQQQEWQFWMADNRSIVTMQQHWGRQNTHRERERVTQAITARDCPIMLQAMRISKYTIIYTYTGTHEHAYLPTYLPTYPPYLPTHPTYLPTLPTSVPTYLLTYSPTCIHANMHICIHPYCIRAYIIHACIYMYIYMCMHVYMDVYIAGRYVT